MADKTIYKDEHERIVSIYNKELKENEMALNVWELLKHKNRHENYSVLQKTTHDKYYFAELIALLNEEGETKLKDQLKDAELRSKNARLLYLE